jgi:hypothetical protein
MCRECQNLGRNPTRKRIQHDMTNQGKQMQWCTVGRETNGLASGRVTHPDGTLPDQ